MIDTQSILEAYEDLEKEMQEFRSIATKVLEILDAKEFIPDSLSEKLLSGANSLNDKQTELFELYAVAELGDSLPKQMSVMRDQIESGMKVQRKVNYLEAVKKSFLSLHTDDAAVSEHLQTFKDKVMKISTDAYSLENCLIYIRPFAVFLTMIKSDDMVKSFEQVPLLMEYFGSELVAHVTVSKDIKLGEDAVDFDMNEPEDAPMEMKTPEEPEATSEDTPEAGDLPLTDMVEGRIERIDEPEVDQQVGRDFEQNYEIDEVEPEFLDPSVPFTGPETPFQEYDVDPEDVKDEFDEFSKLESFGDFDTVAPMAGDSPAPAPKSNKRPSKTKAPRKVDLKALLEEDNFKEDKLNDPELEDMKANKKKRGKKDGGFLNPSGAGKFW